jgi:RHS repeat-associated protein
MPTTRYTNISGQIIAEDRNGAYKFYGADPLGSTATLYDSSGAVTDTFAYWPYGEIRTSSGSTGTPFKFCGTWGYHGNAAGRLYVRARVYREKLTRWQTVDPLWPILKRYGYANNLPNILPDPLGLMTLTIAGAGTLLAGAGTSTGISSGVGTVLAGIGIGLGWGIVVIGAGVAIGGSIGIGLNEATGGGWGNWWCNVLGVDCTGVEYLPPTPPVQPPTINWPLVAGACAIGALFAAMPTFNTCREGFDICVDRTGGGSDYGAKCLFCLWACLDKGLDSWHDNNCDFWNWRSYR